MKRAWIVVVAALVGLGGWWVLTERRWQSPLFCIERPGTLWNGLAPLPAGFTPECPTYSRSYREEIRAGLSRVEMYRVAGWQPHTDSVYFANNPERHRIAGSTSGTRFSPSRIRSD
ncbi:hypothetical protein [Deinococcus sp. 6YEL10]|uniref:hypothetical protein n=1 Tax=Deinococcus sp. 6YEL10 TaxID=2745870 RepID=UPI001E4E6125|nr:hypothetical protein [Deinococcus sp. 6YEL10]